MELRVQLKVCEGCGCLWYRPMCLGSSYCRECELKLKDFPVNLDPPRRAAQHKVTGDRTPLPVWTRRPPLPVVSAVVQSSGGGR
jgi:hypothetical protein